MRAHLSTITDESINAFYTSLKPKLYPKGEIIIKNNDRPLKFFFVLSGIVGCFSKQNNRQYIKALHIKQNPFTNIYALTCNISEIIENYTALTECYLLEGSYEEFVKLTEEHHELSLFYNKVLESAFFKIQLRLDSLSLLDATQRYLSLKDRIPDIENLIPQYQIAHYLNITPVQLSRIRKRLLAGF